MILGNALPMPALPKLSRGNMRVVLKALSWRAVGALDTLAISLFVTGSFAAAGSIMSIEIFTKVGLYIVHERVWDKFR